MTSPAGLFIANATRTAAFERDRAPLEGAPAGDGYRLVVEFFIETAGRARILTAAPRRAPAAERRRRTRGGSSAAKG